MPILLFNIPCLRKSSNIASKNFLGIFSCLAISEMVMGPLSFFLANATKAFMAYFVFLKSCSLKATSNS